MVWNVCRWALVATASLMLECAAEDKPHASQLGATPVRTNPESTAAAPSPTRMRVEQSGDAATTPSSPDLDAADGMVRSNQDSDGSERSPASTDPGAPSIAFGAKGEGTLYRGAEEVGRIFFTAVAPRDPGRAHLFLIPEPRASQGVTDYYVSIVLEQAPWRTGSYRGAVGGRIHIALTDGQHYEASAAEVDLDLTVEQLAGEQEYYLRASLGMSVPRDQEREEPLRVNMQINTPRRTD